ncbi:MAG: hypothetical protein H0X40_17350 [Chthoniobacterales bacterium]|nr:hypothetical protein [Chthoniobacterales bacterium]
MTRNLFFAMFFAALADFTTAGIPDAGGVVPSTFDADRVYVRLTSPDSNSPLVFYTDTGGGLVLSRDALARLKMKTRTVTDPDAIAELGPNAQVVDARAFNSAIDGPKLPDDTFLVVVPEVRQIAEWPKQEDGILGEAWFGGHVWTWNYPGRQLILRSPGWHPEGDARSFSVRFKTDAQGRPVTNFPGIKVQIDGQTIPMLLDTGAETLLTAPSLSKIGDGGPLFRATSMIAKSLFDRWHSSHKDWRVVEDAQVATHAAMIEVPELAIGDLKVGPVWFTERPDANFHEFMSKMMASQVEGSLGGNAFHDLVLTLDYPQARGWVTRGKPQP